jgi:hypothetical protein
MVKQINDMKVVFPDAQTALDQDQEWFEVEKAGQKKRLRASRLR